MVRKTQAAPKEEVVVDAAHKAMGRVASEVALLLQGKRSPHYARHHLEAAPRVRVVGLAKMTIDERRLRERVYYRHSGYLGGLRAQTLEERIKRRGLKEVFRLVVRGMLPRNRLRKHMLARLVLEE